MTLFQHTPHTHQPQNTYLLHRMELSTAGFNQKLAVWITKSTGTMLCAYVFAGLAILGFPGLMTWLGPAIALYVVWTSQTFLQLTFLPIRCVGQGVLGRQQELQASETHETTLSIYHDISQIIAHMHAQDDELLRLSALLERALAIEHTAHTEEGEA